MIRKYRTHHQTGFTLLEMMLVVILIGITVVLVNFNIGRDKDQIAALEARRFAALLQHAREDSQITGKVFGVSIERADSGDGAYQFLQLTDKWQKIERDDVYRLRTVPADIKLQLKLSKKAKKVKGKKFVVINPTGEISEFKAAFFGDKNVYTVLQDETQSIKVKQSKSDEFRS